MIEKSKKSLKNNNENDITEKSIKEEINQIDIHDGKLSGEKKIQPELKTENEKSQTIPTDQNQTVEEKTSEKKKPKTLKEKYEQALKEISDWEKKYMYLQAEMENSRKIMLKRLDNTKYDSKVDGIKNFLPIIESLEAAISKIEKNITDETKTIITPYLHGFRQVQRQFLQILESLGVKPIEKENIPFNYKEHDVMMKFEDDSKDEDTILQIVQKGWYINDNILKPAKVIISKKKHLDKMEDEKNITPDNSESIEDQKIQFETQIGGKSENSI